MPSHTTKIPVRVSYPKLSSLFLRTTPISVFPTAWVVSFMGNPVEALNPTAVAARRKERLEFAKESRPCVLCVPCGSVFLLYSPGMVTVVTQELAHLTTLKLPEPQLRSTMNQSSNRGNDD